MELKEVLIIDDSEADQFLNRYRILEFAPQVKVRAAFDGLEGLEILREPGYRPDLIFLDINMPRMNGFAFLETYVAEFEASAGVVVMLSSSLLESDRERALSFAPVRGFLGKPLNVGWSERVLEMAKTKE